MPQLPPNGELMIEERGGTVRIVDPVTKEEMLSFAGGDLPSVAQAQQRIHDSAMDPETKVFAHFWSGFYYKQLSSGKG